MFKSVTAIKYLFQTNAICLPRITALVIKAVLIAMQDLKNCFGVLVQILLSRIIILNHRQAVETIKGPAI
jgi:hypothetical protein